MQNVCKLTPAQPFRLEGMNKRNAEPAFWVTYYFLCALRASAMSPGLLLVSLTSVRAGSIRSFPFRAIHDAAMVTTVVGTGALAPSPSPAHTRLRAKTKRQS